MSVDWKPSDLVKLENTPVLLSPEEKIKKLEGDIMQKFKISKEHLAKLLLFIKSKKEEEISFLLKAELAELWIIVESWSIDNFSDNLLEISKLREQTRIDIQNLMADLSKSPEIHFYTNPYSFNYSKEIIDKVEDPKTIIDNLLALSIWVLETLYISWKIVFDLWAGIIYLPQDLYYFLSWKRDYPTSKDI